MDVSAVLDKVGNNPTEIGRRLGVSDGHIHDLKTGRRELSVELAAELERLTQIEGLVEAAVARKRAAAEERRRRRQAA